MLVNSKTIEIQSCGKCRLCIVHQMSMKLPFWGSMTCGFDLYLFGKSASCKIWEATTLVLWFVYHNKHFQLPLVGGLEHELYFSICWKSSSQLTNSYFFRGLGIPPISPDPQHFASHRIVTGAKRREFSGMIHNNYQ